MSQEYRVLECAKVGCGQLYEEEKGKINGKVMLFPSKELRMKNAVERDFRADVER